MIELNSKDLVKNNSDKVFIKRQKTNAMASGKGANNKQTIDSSKVSTLPAPPPPPPPPVPSNKQQTNKSIIKSTTSTSTTRCSESTKSDIQIENLVNVLHHFAFGEHNHHNNDGLKKIKSSESGENSNISEDYCDCDAISPSAAAASFLANSRQSKQVKGKTSTVNKSKSDKSSTLHLSLSLAKSSKKEQDGQDATIDREFNPDEQYEDLNEYDNQVEDEDLGEDNNEYESNQDDYDDDYEDLIDEDEQIKKKENLLHELQRIEKQFELKRKQQQQELSLEPLTKKVGEPASTSNSTDSLMAHFNIDSMTTVNKYLIRRCETDLNRLYKSKLRQLQQRSMNETSSSGTGGSSRTTSFSKLMMHKDSGIKKLIQRGRAGSSSEISVGGEKRKLAMPEGLELAKPYSNHTTTISLSDIQPTLFFKSSPSNTNIDQASQTLAVSQKSKPSKK